MTASTTYDNTGAATGLVYRTADQSVVAQFAQLPSAQGLTAAQAGTDGAENYSYDADGRLTVVQDTWKPGGNFSVSARYSYPCWWEGICEETSVPKLFYPRIYPW